MVIFLTTRRKVVRCPDGPQTCDRRDVPAESWTKVVKERVLRRRFHFEERVMARNRGRQKITSQREGGRSSSRVSRGMRVGSAAMILVLIGLFAWTIVRHQSKPT